MAFAFSSSLAISSREIFLTNDFQQAKDRAGGKYGNKGDECAVVAIKMAKF